MPQARTRASRSAQRRVGWLTAVLLGLCYSVGSELRVGVALQDAYLHPSLSLVVDGLSFDVRASDVVAKWWVKNSAQTFWTADDVEVDTAANKAWLSMVPRVAGNHVLEVTVGGQRVGVRRLATIGCTSLPLATQRCYVLAPGLYCLAALTRRHVVALRVCLNRVPPWP